MTVLAAGRFIHQFDNPAKVLAKKTEIYTFGQPRGENKPQSVLIVFLIVNFQT